MNFENLLSTYGYVVLIIGTFLEGETVLVLAGFLAYQGYMDISLVVVLAALGAFLGDSVGYWAGRWKGEKLILRFGTLRKYVPKAQSFVGKHGLKSLFLGRFLYGLRLSLSIIYGILGMNWRKFTLFNFLSCLAWALIIGGVGFLFGRSMEVLLGNIKNVEKIIVLTLATAGLIIWLVRKFMVTRTEKLRKCLKRCFKTKLNTE